MKEDRAGDPAEWLSIPSRLEVEDAFDGTTISWKWRSWGLLVLGAFVVFWDAFLVNWYGMVWRQWDSRGGPFQWIPALFPLFHVAVGVGMTAYFVVSLFNSTRVRIGRSGVSATNGPIPWGRRREYAFGEISQVVLRVVVTRKGGVGCRVLVANASGRERVLVASAPDRESGFYVAATLASALGFRELPDPGGSGMGCRWVPRD